MTATLTASPAVRATGVRHRFGDTVAVDGVDFDVPAGTVFGLLGPNGAGKTTAVPVGRAAPADRAGPRRAR